ncbi:MAG: alpha/beta fold hydrolase [Bdellovibrionaceae bacterium]|nr:alpha/beta fold hydrolase [Pseudobdellovibrionaceae bacterium]
MQSVLIVCLHGFLGRGEDWDSLKSTIRKNIPYVKIDFWCPSLLNGSSHLGPEILFKDWPEKFVNELSQFEYQKCILMGYSMGGRLALNTLAKFPEKFNSAIFLSTNPMVLNIDQAKERRQQDQDWIKKILKLEWSTLIKEWDQQNLFAGDKVHPQRREEDYSRKSLAQALQNWSIVHHQLSLNEISKIKVPSLWVMGEQDVKYVAILKHLQDKGLPADGLILPDCGHRIIIGEQTNLKDKLIEFIEKTLK